MKRKRNEMKITLTYKTQMKRNENESKHVFRKYIHYKTINVYIYSKFFLIEALRS